MFVKIAHNNIFVSDIVILLLHSRARSLSPCLAQTRVPSPHEKIGFSVSPSLTHGTLLPMEHWLLISGDMLSLCGKHLLAHSNIFYSESHFTLSSSSLLGLFHSFLESFSSDTNLISLAHKYIHSLPASDRTHTHSFTSRLQGSTHHQAT